MHEVSVTKGEIYWQYCTFNVVVVVGYGAYTRLYV